MIPDLSLVIDLRPLLLQLDMRDKQISFAASKTVKDLTWLARGAAVESTRDGRFTVRRDWILKGWRTKVLKDDGSTSHFRRASRREFAYRLFHLDSYMGRQEHGGEKAGRSGHRIAIAGRSVRDTKPTSKSSAKMPEKWWPENLLRTKRGFATSRDGSPIVGASGAQLVMERREGTERGTPRRAQGRLARALFGAKYDRLRKPRSGRRLKREARIRAILVHRGDVRPRLGLVKRTQQVVRDAFWQVFQKNYAEALRTARP